MRVVQLEEGDKGDEGTLMCPKVVNGILGKSILLITFIFIDLHKVKVLFL